jgi:hypothetical protein
MHTCVPIFGSVADSGLIASMPHELQLLLKAVGEWCEVFDVFVRCSETRIVINAGAGQVGHEDLGPLQNSAPEAARAP